MSRRNYVLLLGLNPEDEVKDASRLPDILRQAKNRWNQKRNHPRDGAQMLKNLEQYPDIERVLLNPDRRAQEYVTARREQAAEKEVAYQRLNEMLSVLQSQDAISAVELAHLCKSLPQLSEADIRARLTLPVNEAPDTFSSQELERTLFQQITTQLKMVDASSLYAVLDLSPEASLSQLQRATQELYDTYSQKANKTSQVTAYMNLSGLCKVVFETAANKQRYDTSRMYQQLESLHPSIELAGLSGQIDAQKFGNLLKQANRLGVSEPQAQNYLIQFCKQNNWSYNLPILPAAKPTPTPAPRPMPNPPPPSARPTPERKHSPPPASPKNTDAIVGVIVILLGVGLVGFGGFKAWSWWQSGTRVSETHLEDSQDWPMLGSVAESGTRVSETPLTATPSHSTPLVTKSTNQLGMHFVWIEPGSFMMGSPDGEGGSDEHPQHPVTLTQGFYLQTTEVTQAQWEAVMGHNPSQFKGDKHRPVERVSWENVQEYLTKLNQRGEGQYRLPTEAEWEYAARAGSSARYACGDSESCLEQMGWFNDNARGETHPVAQKKPNAWGLYDMHGNVWENVHDWYGPYSSGAQTNPTGPVTGSNRVLRGGGWGYDADFARSAFRSGGNRPSNYLINVGFRLVRLP